MRIVKSSPSRRVAKTRKCAVRKTMLLKPARLKRLARECAKLDPAEERAMAEEWQSGRVDELYAY